MFTLVLAKANLDEIKLETSEAIELTATLELAVDVSETLVSDATALESDEISELIPALTDDAIKEIELLITLLTAEVGIMLLLLLLLDVAVAVMAALDMEASIDENASEAELIRADTLELISAWSIEANLETEDVAVAT